MTKNQDEANLPEPFHDNELKSRLKRFLTVPETIVFPNHALERMEDHGMETTDVFNVLRAGSVWGDFRECVRGRWRYCVGTRKFRVMFLFEEDALVIVTAIRLEPKP